jgi:hypothetical protein
MELEGERKPLDSVEAKRIAQADFDVTFSKAKSFYDYFNFA